MMHNIYTTTCLLLLGVSTHGEVYQSGAPTPYGDTPALYDEGDFWVDFLVTSANHNLSDTSQHFVARITDEAAANTARNELNKTSSWMIISGIIQNTTVDWNPGWSYHIQPDTVFFGDFFIEVCDASTTYVEEHLDEAGGAFLPNYQWCPWGTAILKELGSSSSTPAPSTASPTTAVPTNLRTLFPSSAPAPDDEDSDDDGSSATMIEYAGWSIFSFALMTIMQ